MPRAGLAGLLFLSGAVSLVYQVLWLEELRRLFGSSAQASATTLSIFFLGLAVGGAVFGRVAPRLRAPLRVYAGLELGVALSALLYFVLLDAYHGVYQPLYVALAERPLWFAAARVALSTAVLFPAACFMGGTLPVVAQHVVRRPSDLGPVGALFYATNTLGAATGAFLAGFVLPPLLGFGGAYVLAVVVNLGVAASAWRLARPSGAVGQSPAPASEPRASRREESGPRGSGRPGLSPEVALIVAFGSGVTALGLEVIWTRMFAQVLQNSVYSFSAILVVFLASLGAGSLVARRLCRLASPPVQVLWVLLSLSGIAVGATPLLFYDLTAGLTSLPTGRGFVLYVVSIFVDVSLLLFVPVALLGTVFPYLWRAADTAGEAAGSVVGRLNASNTAGGVIGSLLAGFVLLETAGLWGSLQALAAVYPLLAILVLWTDRATPARRRHPRPVAATLASLAVLGLLATALDVSDLALVQVNAERGERILDTWEGADGVVAVVERASGRRIKVNNFYALGGTAALEHEQNQALIPLMTHPRPDSVFFLGLGTGITAGAALRHPVGRVTVCELLPQVITAAATHFNEAASGLFTDPRARVLPCDGRNHLLGTAERYDVILADLFIPWRAGVGGLYSREHFAAARERLAPDGIFVQWLPLYQLSRSEFDLIARTMLDVFGGVTVWRGDFFATRPILALVGSRDPRRLDREAVVRNGRHLAGDSSLPEAVPLAVTLPFYVGNLSAAADLIPEGPLNTDDRPRIAYSAPVTHREERAGRASWFTSSALIDFLDDLAARVPPARDPYLVRLTPDERQYASAGLSYHKAAVAERDGRSGEAAAHRREFERRLPVAFRPSLVEDDAHSAFGPPPDGSP